MSSSSAGDSQFPLPSSHLRAMLPLLLVICTCVWWQVPCCINRIRFPFLFTTLHKCWCRSRSCFYRELWLHPSIFHSHRNSLLRCCIEDKNLCFGFGLGFVSYHVLPSSFPIFYFALGATWLLHLKNATLLCSCHQASHPACQVYPA